ncbi:hypothetical protein ACXITP_07140 [Actinotignum sanguinis]|uniref:Uncharacterized protein n=3 Tax=Actinomycetaceae TaxID=2049 RepID=S2VJD2_9ACTO|nr:MULTISPECIES: hypothetical protein [Actinotignum]WPJ89828.1 hypothetical protein R0V15_04375 [Schaalia turicensis]EPD26090.1 hypothetical protein HMPREF9237_01365 [Actinotignum schaalii FB123-CNA-2]MDE1553130.1 hypothetical protein [Actinotignum sanguinis]MDE1565626.1 hypothetical protein [Actinotignum sanguinis]MDE1576883.1 hypothetical protein [Actinotignum sanguinis]
MTAPAKAPTPRERGNILILGLGVWAVSAILCLGFIYLTTVLTARHTLQGQADSAALAISQEIAQECYFSAASLADCHPSTATVRQLAAAIFPADHVLPDTGADSAGVVVAIEKTVRLPVVDLPVSIRAQARARLDLR